MKVLPRERSGYEVGWLVWRVVEAAGQADDATADALSATFFVRAEFRLRHGEAAEPITDRPIVCSGDVPHAEARQGLAYPNDYVPYKPLGEWMAIGTAHNAGWGDRHKFGARVRIGDHAKLVDVVGDRSWQPTLLRWEPGPPAAIDTVPLTYDRAWGGPAHAANPLGRGQAGDAMHNLEIPGAWIDSRSSPALPAGFGPLPSTWAQRKQWMGRYNARWIRDHWPWLPPDFDIRFFMAAPEDQWVDGYFRGDEPIVLEQMHPVHAVYQSRLPGVRARCFVSQRSGAGAAGKPGHWGEELHFREVPLHLDTVWIDADQEKLVLAWRGHLPVASLKLLDVEHLLSVLEPLDEPDRGLRFFEEMLAAELTPADRSPPFDPAALRAEIDAALAKAAKERADFEAMMADQLAKAEAAMAAKQQEAVAKARELGVDWQPPDAAAIAAAPKSLEEGIASMRQDLAALEAFTGFDVSQEIANLKQAIANAEEAAALVAGFPEQVRAREEEILSKIPPELLVVRKLPDGEPIDLEAARASGYAKFDLAGVDFSGLDLSGIDFREAKLTGAKLVRTTLGKADFTGANLTGADLTGADLRGATLDDADLTDAVVPYTRWAGASLSGTRMSGLQLAGADFTGVHGLRADFSNAMLAESCFANADLEKADFSGAIVQRADFSGARLTRAEFGGAHAAGIVLRGAELTNLRARERADFTGAVVAGAVADDSAWGTSILDGADFREATLRRARFSEASLREAMFDDCNLANAVFDDADLERAMLMHANLLRATFDRANLTNARLDGSNLFEAGLWETRLEGATYAGANVKRTRLAE
jgi:uncharacterized protein YjbI with pentapeptide repeats